MSHSRSAGIWEKDVLVFLPGPETAGREQGRECLAGLREALRERGAGPGAVVKTTFFVRASDQADFDRRKRAAAADLRSVFSSSGAALGVVAQPPEGGRETALEAVVLRRPSRALEIVPRIHRGVRYVLLRSAAGCELVAGGISGGRSGDIGVRASAAFARASGVLAREGLGFADVVRQWNFIEAITGGPSGGPRGRQNYQIFNDIRACAYGRAGLREGYPAATGIGQSAGGFVLELAAAAGAAAERAFPVSNPLQTDAHRYTDEVLAGAPASARSGKETPKFERAKVVLRGDRGTCFVSGTAAIVGQDIVSPGDVAGQTRATIRNIERLVAPVNLRRSGVPVSSVERRFSRVRVYVKREADLPEVGKIVRESFGPAPALLVVADVCREDLLVEIEGEVEVRAA